MYSEWLVLLVIPGMLLIGIAAGMGLYRTLWHVDTSTLREEVSRLRSLNGALQDQMFEMKTQLEEMRSRVRTLEEVNNELIQREKFRERSGR